MKRRKFFSWFGSLLSAAVGIVMARPALASNRTGCKFGDPSCPCQDGDQCHYTGEGAWPPPIDEIRSCELRNGAFCLCGDGEHCRYTPRLASGAEILKSFDARDWARHFVAHVKAYPGIPLDEETMTGWFANAIMRGWDECDRMYNTQFGDVESGWKLRGPALAFNSNQRLGGQGAADSMLPQG